MAKNESKSSRAYLIGNCILLVIIIALAVLSYLSYRNHNSLKEEKTTVEKEYNRVVDENANLIYSGEELDKQIKEAADVESKIKAIKEETFANISKLEKKIQAKETDAKIAYLTFDDGPYYNSWNVLETLDKYGLKATFFTTNINGEKCYENKSANCHELYKEYAKRNMTIANHTYTHAIHKGLYRSTDSFITAVKNQEQLISDLTGGYKTTIVRYPGGSGSAKAYKVFEGTSKKLHEMGYGWVDWTAADGDGGSGLTTDKAWSNFTHSIDQDIEVILFHDYSRITVPLLPKFIEHLQSKGYLILPLFYDSVMVNK
jgi:peptidoglycan/xylan/chitin deacetylase (PgdA/CDA1 family)